MFDQGMLHEITLRRGVHTNREEGVCALELVAWMAGEEHSDHPACVCPVIASFVRKWNDDLPDGDRGRLLKPLLPGLIGTACPQLIERRAWMIADWLVRVYAPAWLNTVPALRDQAAALRGLDELEDVASAAASYVASAAARDAARGAANAAANAAASAAANAAASYAASYAAWYAARYADRYAARDAASAAAWYAASAAASAAAWAAFDPTVATLQASAQDLVRRMCEVKS